MKYYALIVLALLAGCRTVDHMDQRSSQLDRDREQTRRFAICMKQSLGPFGAFAAPSVRQQAAQTCQGVMQPTAAAATATNP